MGVGAYKGLSRKCKSFQVNLMAYAVSSSGEYDALLIGYSPQVFVVVEVFETNLYCVMVDITYSELILDFVQPDGFKLKIGHCTCCILSKSLIDFDSDCLSLFKSTIHEMGGEDLVTHCLSHNYHLGDNLLLFKHRNKAIQKKRWLICHRPSFYRTSARCLATKTPDAEAWEREWVTPLQSPITNKPLCLVSRLLSMETSIL